MLSTPVAGLDRHSRPATGSLGGTTVANAAPQRNVTMEYVTSRSRFVDGRAAFVFERASTLDPQTHPLALVEVTGRVGVGTTAPEAALHVVGQVQIAGGEPGEGKVFTSDAKGLGRWESPAVPAAAIVGPPAATPSALAVFADATGKVLRNSGVIVDSQNKITAPSLEITAELFVADGTQAAGRRLTCDSAGKASWQPLPPAVSPPPWSLMGAVPVFADATGQSLSTTSVTIENDGELRTPALRVNGPVYLADGTQGQGRVLFSAPDGQATWQDPPFLRANGGGPMFSIPVSAGGFPATVTFSSATIDPSGHATFANLAVQGPAQFSNDLTLAGPGGFYLLDGTQGPNRVMVGDLSGRATWTPRTWLPNGAFIYSTSTRVGINTQTPDQSLSIGSGTASKPGGGSFAALSDRRVKKDISPFTDGLSAVEALSPVSYRYNGKGDYEDDGETYVGVVAQEVLPVLPCTIKKTPKKLDPGDAEPTELLTFDPSPLVFVLINAVKEQQAEIRALRADVLALKASVSGHASDMSTKGLTP